MRDKLRAIIVDDEPLARRGLRLRLNHIDEVEVVSECNNGREAVRAVADLTPDVLFLDIQMPGMNGFDVVARLQQYETPQVIFTTAYDRYAIEAFNVHAVDYLLKPIDQDRLQHAIGRVRDNQKLYDAEVEKERLLVMIMSITGRSEISIAQLLKDHKPLQPYPRKLAVKDGLETSIIETSDIDWVDAAGDYMCIHVGDDIHVMRITMKDLEMQLDPKIFQRVHRSTIVNLDKVTKVRSHANGEFHLMLVNGVSIKMSRSYKDKVSHFL